MSRGEQANKENRRAVASLEEERSGKSRSASKHCRAWPLLMAVERNQSPQRSAQLSLKNHVNCVLGSPRGLWRRLILTDSMHGEGTLSLPTLHWSPLGPLDLALLTWCHLKKKMDGTRERRECESQRLAEEPAQHWQYSSTTAALPEPRAEQTARAWQTQWPWRQRGSDQSCSTGGRTALAAACVTSEVQDAREMSRVLRQFRKRKINWTKIYSLKV